MSDYATSQLRRNLMLEAAMANRFKLASMVLQMIISEFYYLQATKYEEKSILLSRSVCLIDYLKTIPDILISRNPKKEDAEKVYEDFKIMHNAWIDDQIGSNFIEWLQIKTQMHDLYKKD